MTIPQLRLFPFNREGEIDSFGATSEIIILKKTSVARFQFSFRSCLRNTSNILTNGQIKRKMCINQDIENCATFVQSNH